MEKRPYCPAHRLFWSNGDVQPSTGHLSKRNIVPNVDGNGHDRLGAHVIREQSKVAVGRDERKQTFRLKGKKELRLKQPVQASEVLFFEQ